MSNTSTPSPLEAALSRVPKEFRSKIIACYLDVRRNIQDARHDAVGLAAGKFCETVLRLLQHRVLGTSIPFTSEVSNFPKLIRDLVESPNQNVSESEKIVIPRALLFLYTMRNKRGIGHIGGDVDANGIDSAVIARTADWSICELIRIHHGLSLEEAQDIVDGLAVRTLPDIWEVGGKKRVIRQGLSAKEESMLLLYHTVESAVLVEDLIDWVEYSNSGVFKKTVLSPLHADRLIEWDRASETVTLSPKGSKFVEESLLKQTTI